MFFTLAGTVIWLILIFMAPFLRSFDSQWNVLIYGLFSPTCHQIESRCFFVFGSPLAVCTRCLGIYLGFFSGTLLFILQKPSPLGLPRARTFLLLTIPLALDGLANFLGIWHTPNLLRLGIGALWGILLPYYFISGVADALSKKTQTIHLK